MRIQQFILSYLVCWDAAQAARDAGYSHRRAPATGSEMLRRPEVVKAIAAHQAMNAATVDVSPDEVLRELKLLAFSDVSDYEVDEISGTLRVLQGRDQNKIRAVQSVKFRTKTDPDGNVFRETEVKLWDKVTPLITAGKHVGLFTDERLRRIAEGLIKEATARELAKLGPDARKFIDAEAAS